MLLQSLVRKIFELVNFYWISTIRRLIVGLDWTLSELRVEIISIDLRFKLRNERWFEFTIEQWIPVKVLEPGMVFDLLCRFMTQTFGGLFVKQFF